MLCVFVNSVFSKHILKKEERVVVLVLYAWCIIEHSNIAVDHLIVSDEK